MDDGQSILPKVSEIVLEESSVDSLETVNTSFKVLVVSISMDKIQASSTTSMNFASSDVSSSPMEASTGVRLVRHRKLYTPDEPTGANNECESAYILLLAFEGDEVVHQTPRAGEKCASPGRPRGSGTTPSQTNSAG